MYYPIQIPFILNAEFSQNAKYLEVSAEECNGFVICFWEMLPLSDRSISITNIIATDACIDLVANYEAKEIGFAGMSKTTFDFNLELPSRSFGARLMPGAFHQITGLPASAAMDTFLPVDEAFKDFDTEAFFSLSFDEAKAYFKKVLVEHTQNKTPDTFTSLFNILSENIPSSVDELGDFLHFSPRQCQRLFQQHYAISPKKALSIIRFHRCMEILASPQATPSDILKATNYYDQPHFIKDFKQNLGITPLELIHAYRA